MAAKNLVIVESPAKAKTLEKYLGRDFQVKASVGHVVDLPKSKLGVDIKKDFAPDFHVIQAKKKVIDDLKKAAKGKEKSVRVRDPDYDTVQEDCSALRIQLTRDLHSRQRSAFRYFGV